MFLKHFYDSLTINKICNLNKVDNICDIGSGAGFPGIVLKIFFPHLNITLVESVKKKTAFLSLIIKELNLSNIRVVNERAEFFALKNREKYDIVTARAVAKLSILSELCLPLTKVGGFFIAMKAKSVGEIESSKNSIEKLGGKIYKIDKFLLPIEESTRTLIKIIKETPTLSIYPRKFEKIKEKPL